MSWWLAAQQAAQTGEHEHVWCIAGLGNAGIGSSTAGHGICLPLAPVVTSGALLPPER